VPSRSLDVRSRTSADIRTIDPDAFLGEELPRLLEERGHLAAGAARAFGAGTFAVALPGREHTLAFDGSSFDVRAGSGGDAAVMLDDAELADIVNDLKTPMTLLTGGTLRMSRGRLEDFLDWWVLLRSVLDERPAYEPGAIDFRDRLGAPLDLTQAFTPDAGDEDLAHFLREAGYLHLRGWLDPADMDRISADMDRALPTYTPDDGNSWWAETRNGDHRCVRMQNFDAHSPTTTRVLEGDELARIAALTDDGHAVTRFGSSRVEALEKPIGVVKGISDVPWHKDCSLGMHSYNCCSLVVGVSVTGADASCGQLRVVAGSHRALVQPAFVRKGLDLPVVELPTEQGDLTVHCSCTLHMAQPPVDHERRVLYTGLRLRPKDTNDALAAGMRDIGRVREASYKTVSQPAAP
jgi:hypothetical protein